MTTDLPPAIAAQLVRLFRGERLYSRSPASVIIASIARQLDVDPARIRDLLSARGLLAADTDAIAVKMLGPPQKEVRKRMEAAQVKPGEQLGQASPALHEPISEGRASDEAAEIVSVSASNIAYTKAVAERDRCAERAAPRAPSHQATAPNRASRSLQPDWPDHDVDLTEPQVRLIRALRRDFRLSFERLGGLTGVMPDQVARLCVPLPQPPAQITREESL